MFGLKIATWARGAALAENWAEAGRRYDAVPGYQAMADCEMSITWEMDQVTLS